MVTPLVQNGLLIVNRFCLVLHGVEAIRHLAISELLQVDVGLLVSLKDVSDWGARKTREPLLCVLQIRHYLY